MSRIQAFISLVKKDLAQLEGEILPSVDQDDPRYQIWLANANLHRLLLSYLEEKASIEAKISSGATSDLPPEVQSLLKQTQQSDLEEKILSVFDAGENLDIDAIIIGLYRIHKYIPKSRDYLSNKLAAMARKEFIERVPKRKGVYRIPRLKEPTPETEEGS